MLKSVSIALILHHHQFLLIAIVIVDIVYNSRLSVFISVDVNDFVI